ncbi:MAG: GDSL-type esterase/lipase family protein [Planctomycetaceae bacterium]|jgi:lysophospholipase L1-like esterase|nr:GDSL-type esterase/lipase family protein [Planctomycetaceae bacterium]
MKYFCSILFVSVVCLFPSFIVAQHNKAPTTRIVLLGDSTTATRDSIKIYGMLLDETFRSKNIGVTIINSGVGGNTSSDGKRTFQERVVAQNPDLLVIQFGLNDSAIDVWKNPSVVKSRVSQSQYEENLRWMIGQMKSRKIPVILMTTNQMIWTPKLKELYGKPPYNPDDPKSFTDTALRDYNNIVRKVAESENVPLVDIFKAYDEYAEKHGGKIDNLLLDGIHPNNEGQKLVFDLLYPMIRKMVIF